jgi:predicted RNA-binding protein with RPS1 domain
VTRCLRGSRSIPKGTIVKGVVTEVDAKGATVDVGGLEGYLRASELSRERVEDARTVLKQGEEIEARFIGLDRKSRQISLSIKAKEVWEEAEAMQSYKKSERRREPVSATCSRSRSRVRRIPDGNRGGPPSCGPPFLGNPAGWKLGPQTDRYNDKVGTDRGNLTSPEPLEREGCRARGQVPDRGHEQQPGERRANRDSRLRQLLAAFPPAADRGATPRLARRWRCPASTCRISSPARTCASGSTTGVITRSRPERPWAGPGAYGPVGADTIDPGLRSGALTARSS